MTDFRDGREQRAATAENAGFSAVLRENHVH
jgi:hypothetical protein